MTSDDAARALATDVARRSYFKLVAFLSAKTRDVSAAEDALSEAFAKALEDWPKSGCPKNPDAWLLTVARRKVVDAARRDARADSANAEIRILTDHLETEGAKDNETIPDRRLALMFACAHPAIDEGARSALILQVILGLDAARIASAFLTSPAAMSKRLVRAKEKIRVARVAFRIPDRDELSVRVDSVLDAIYGAFSEGWNDPGGADPVSRDLSEEAIFLARVTVELLPESAEAIGLLALMLHAHARRNARRDEAGQFVPFAEQDSSRWRWSEIEEAESMLVRASALKSIGRYQLEAALQSAHVARRRIGTNNWEDVVALYEALAAVAPSPVVAINRAVAIAEARGAAAGLDAMPSRADTPRLESYQPYWAARAELLLRTGQTDESLAAFDVAIGLERDPAVRAFLQKRTGAIGRVS